MHLTSNRTENTPKLTYDENRKISDTRTKKDESFMEICGNEDWKPQYEDIAWPLEEITMETTGGDKIRVDVDSVERVKIRYNGKSQQDHQTVAVDQDSNMDAKGRALTWKEGPTQQE